MDARYGVHHLLGGFSGMFHITKFVRLVGLLVPRRKYRYSKIRVLSLYGRSENRGGFAIFF